MAKLHRRLKNRLKTKRQRQEEQLFSYQVVNNLMVPEAERLLGKLSYRLKLKRMVYAGESGFTSTIAGKPLKTTRRLTTSHHDTHSAIAKVVYSVGYDAESDKEYTLTASILFGAKLLDPASKAYEKKDKVNGVLAWSPWSPWTYLLEDGDGNILFKRHVCVVPTGSPEGGEYDLDETVGVWLNFEKAMIRKMEQQVSSYVNSIPAYRHRLELSGVLDAIGL